MATPEPGYSPGHPDKPWNWCPDVDCPEMYPWEAGDRLTGELRWHLVTHAHHYATRAEAMADLDAARAGERGTG